MLVSTSFLFEFFHTVRLPLFNAAMQDETSTAAGR